MMAKLEGFETSTWSFNIPCHLPASASSVTIHFNAFILADKR